MKQILIEKYIEPNETYIDIFDRKINCWEEFGKLHSFLGNPSKVVYYGNGSVYSMHWHKKGIKHREKSLYSCVFYNENGKITCKRWNKNGEFIKQEIY
jgi:hypothetical protein